MSEEFDRERDFSSIKIGGGGTLFCRNSIHTGENQMGRDWCDHLKRTIEAGADAELLHAEMHINVPIFPTAEIFAEVYIGEDIGNGSGLMSLGFTPDIGRPYSVPLGFWNPGEGCGSIRTVILDFLRSKLDPEETFQPGPIKTRCPATIHGMREARLMREDAQNQRWKLACLWNIVMEKACTGCIEQSSGDDGNFGIDESITANRKPWQS